MAYVVLYDRAEAADAMLAQAGERAHVVEDLINALDGAEFATQPAVIDNEANATNLAAWVAQANAAFGGGGLG